MAAQKSRVSSAPIWSMSLRTDQGGCEVVIAMCSAGSFSAEGQVQSAPLSARFAKDPVYKPDYVRRLARFGNVDRLVYRGVVGNSVQEDYLIECEPQQDANGDGDFIRFCLAQPVDVPVQAALPADHSIDEFGHECPVPFVHH